VALSPRRRAPLPRTGDRVLDDVGRRVERELDATAQGAAQRWTVRDARGATGEIRAGDYLRIYRACTVAVPPPGASAVGREAMAAASAAGGFTITLEALPGCTILGATSTSTAWGALRLVAVTATDWEVR